MCVVFFLHFVKSIGAWKVKWFFLINLNWVAEKTVENVLHVVEKRNFTETISECPALDYFLMNWTTAIFIHPVIFVLTNGNWQYSINKCKKREKKNSVKFETLLQCDSVLKSAIYLKCHWFQSIIICSSQCAQIHRSPTIQLHILFDSALLSSCTTSISPWIYFSIVFKADNTKSRIYFTCICIPNSSHQRTLHVTYFVTNKKKFVHRNCCIFFCLFVCCCFSDFILLLFASICNFSIQVFVTMEAHKLVGIASSTVDAAQF